jgi:hypothetical protein
MEEPLFSVLSLQPSSEKAPAVAQVQGGDLFGEQQRMAFREQEDTGPQFIVFVTLEARARATSTL